MADTVAFRLLVDDDVDAAAGLAVDEALMAGCARDADPPRPTLRLYTYRSHSALVGRYQSLAGELDLDRCRETGTGVGRRPTGGGAIVMGRDQLGVALIVPAPPRPPRQLLRELSAGVLAGLAGLGVPAEFGGKNDLLVNGRKIAGLGMYTDGSGAVLFHASVLADLDIDFMLQVLNIPAAKLARHGASAVAQRVTTVTRETGQRHSGAGIRSAIADGFTETLGVRLERGELTSAETAEAERLIHTRYADPEWLYPKAAAPDGTGTARFRSPDGPVRVFVAAQGSLIKSVLFTGDFTAPPDALTRLESTLRWQRLDPAAVERAVRESTGGTGTDGWHSPAEVVTAVLTAGARALEHATAHPHRATGSCYFPDTPSRDAE
ncbi:MAG: lipoate--protein ligase family protein [Actinobacteria bacterium]|nr:lipoate--protein ligase family protein [Actinomycetota bacterium]